MILKQKKDKKEIVKELYKEIVQRKKADRLIQEINDVFQFQITICNILLFPFILIRRGYKLNKLLKKNKVMKEIDKVDKEQLIYAYKMCVRYNQHAVTVKEMALYLDSTIGGKSCKTCRGRMNGRTDMLLKVLNKRINTLYSFIFKYPDIQSSKYTTPYYETSWVSMSFRQMRMFTDSIQKEINVMKRKRVDVSILSMLENDLLKFKQDQLDRMNLNYLETQFALEEERKDEIFKKETKKYYKLSKTKLKKCYQYHLEGWTMTRIHKEYLKKFLSYQQFTRIFKEFKEVTEGLL